MKKQPITQAYNIYRTGLSINVILGTYFAIDSEEAIDMHCEDSYHEDSIIGMKRYLKATEVIEHNIYEEIANSVDSIVTICNSIEEAKESKTLPLFSALEKEEWISTHSERIKELGFVLNQLENKRYVN